MSLPTYEQAVARPLLIELVVPYLMPHDLAVASRVCRSWEKACTPALWRDPVKVLSRQDLPYSVKAREERQELIHTLDFRPLIALQPKYPKDYDVNIQYMNGLYILHVCYLLHHVKVIILDGIVDWTPSSQYDYVERGFESDKLNLETLDSSGPSRPIPSRHSSTSTSASQPTHTPNLPPIADGRSDRKELHLGAKLAHNDNAQLSHPFRPFFPTLLSLKGCSGVDGIRVMCFACFQTRDLTFLDLSFTACGTAYFSSFSNLLFPSLRILKLRGIRLTDRQIPKLDMRSGGNVWSLDLRDNFLTDRSVEILYGWFLPSLPMQFTDQSLRNYHPPPSYGRDFESSRDATNGIVELRSDTKDDFITHLATNPHMNLEVDPFLRRTGLTHLYLSGNKFSSVGIRKLLSQTNRLNVLDIGTVRDQTDIHFRSCHAISWDQIKSVSSFKISSDYNIKSLRIHHSFVTCMPTVSYTTEDNYSVKTPADFSSRFLLAAETAGRARVEKKFAAFLPMDNSLIETLELTAVPTKSYGFLIQRLLGFLDACRKQEQELSAARVTTHRRAPEVLPGLKTLRLEFLPPDNVDATAPSHRGSVSGDPDADAFSAASYADFSFFADLEEVWMPPRTPAPASQAGTGTEGTPVSEAELLRDVVEELKKARREAGENKWGGNLEIVLPQVPPPNTEWREPMF